MNPSGINSEGKSAPVALVTGAAHRIGRAIAEDLARAGFAVAVHFHAGRDQAEAVVDGIVRAGGKAAAFDADLTDIAATESLVSEVKASLGAPVLLVNNASLFEADSLSDLDWNRWDRHFDIHAKATVALTRSFAQHLPAGSEGLVVNIIDQRVWKLTPRYFSYSLSKSALWAATRTMAQALAPHIRVNAIGPGPTLPNSRQTEADFAAQVDALLLRRGPSLSEFGATIRYLWEARSVTGQMIALDGGQHLAWQTPDVMGGGE
jgi:NAD(P)-dependent dehydrogenase (short-subunit alcohol dehydrogenase family)